MNKSKLLKKSLAMLLAMLMVVAMIPLGASAAESALTELAAIHINGTTVTASGKTFKADITDPSAVKIFVDGLYHNETADILDTTGTAHDVRTEQTVDMDDYGDAGSTEYAITLRLTSEDKSNTADYTIQLKVVEDRTTTELNTVKIDKAADHAISASITAKIINVTAPLGYTNEASLVFTTKDGAQITAGGDMTDNGNGTWTLATVEDGDTVEVVSESGGNLTTYTVKVTEQPVITAIKFGAVSGSIDNTKDKEKISATLNPSVLHKPDTEYKCEAQQMAITFETFPGTTVKYGHVNTAGSSPVLDTTGVAYGAVTTLTSGKQYNLTSETTLGTADKDAYGDFLFAADAGIEVTCKGISKIYPLELKTETANVNLVSKVVVDNESTTISGLKITGNLQSGLQAADKVSVVVTAPYKATVTKGDGNAFTPARVEDKDGNDTYTLVATDPNAYTVGELKAGVVFVVTSQSGVQKQYELKMTATGDVDNTEITAFGLKIGGTVYQGTVNQSTRKIAVTVPYMTTDAALAAADVIVTTNPYVEAGNLEDKTDPSYTLAAKGASINLNAFTLRNNYSTKVYTGTATGTIWAVAKNGSAPATAYDITVTLENAKTGKVALNNLTVSSAKDWKSLNNDNTYAAVKKEVTNDSGKGNTATVKIAHSEYEKGVNLYIKTLDTTNGGVVFMANATGTAPNFNNGDYTVGAKPVGYLDSVKTAVSPVAPFVTVPAGGKNTDYLVVLPEVEARKELTNAGDGVLTDAAKYNLVIDDIGAKSGCTLTRVKVGDTTITSSFNTTLPYGLTVANGATTALNTDKLKGDNSHFLTIVNTTDIATFAKLYAADTALANANALNAAVTAGTVIGFTSNGDTNGDGEADAASKTNGKLVFERDENNKVNVYAWGGAGEALMEVKYFYVLSEDKLNIHQYPGNAGVTAMKYAAPNTEAKISSFKLAGATGTIVSQGNDNWTITVNVPYGTKLSSLVPTFTVSANATVFQGTDKVKSGETPLNFSNDVVLRVTSEDGNKTVTYTVKAVVSDEFSDVPATAWYHDNVMNAVAAGLMAGDANASTFRPTANITRAEFAATIMNLMSKRGTNAGNHVATTAPFLDVTEPGWVMNAVDYCKQNDIMAGGTDGNFRPSDKITRQEVATTIANALKLSGTPETPFKDINTAASWAVGPIGACQLAGIMNGDAGNFNPKANITRAEVASTVLNALNK